MATGKALNGKPYAGNPHVRFDEGAGAPRHSGRSALLYKLHDIQKNCGLIVPILAMLCVAVAPMTSFAEAKQATLLVAGYTGSTTLTDFQALVKLSASNDAYGFSYAEAEADGSDLWFTDANGNVIPHEIDTWNSSGDSLVWVKIPSLKKGTEIVMHWGDLNTKQTATENTWTGFVGVWHMNGTGTTAEPDSTTNSLSATPKITSGTANIDTATGKVGKGRSNIANARLEVASTYKDKIKTASQFTVGGWFKMNRTDTKSSGSYPRILTGNGSTGTRNTWEVWQNLDANAASDTLRVLGGSNSDSIYSGTRLVASQWVYLMVVYNGAKATLYLDGVSKGEKTITAATHKNAFSIGAIGTTANRSLVGVMDEVRMYNGGLSGDRIAADYATMNNATNFLKLQTTYTWAGSEQWSSDFATAGNWKKGGVAATSLDGTVICLPDGASQTFTYVTWNPVDLQSTTFRTSGTATFDDVGGFRLKTVVVDETGKMVYDPTKFTFRLAEPPSFASGAKIALASKYAANTNGRFLLMTWDTGSLSMDGAALTAVFDATSANGTTPKVWAENFSGGGGRLWLDLDYGTTKQRVNVLPVGDSITHGRDSEWGNWRTGLMKKLAAAGYEPIAKGHRYDQSLDICGAMMPDEWISHAGISSQRLITSGKGGGTIDAIENFLDQAGDVDFVLCMLGTNDINSDGRTPEELFPVWSNLVEKVIAQKPTAKFIAGAVVDIATNSAANITKNERVIAYNAMVRGAVEGGMFPEKRAYFADLYTPCYRYDSNGNYITGTFYSATNLHPDWPNEDKIADVYCAAILNALADDPGFTPGQAETGIPTTSDATNNVPAAYLDGFKCARVFDVAGHFETKLSGSVPYENYRDPAAVTQNIGRVGYYIELKRKDDGVHQYHGLTRWLWVSMDAFGNTIDDVGVPLLSVYQGPASHLKIASNMPGIEQVAADGEGVDGWVEFWPNSYATNECEIAAAPANKYGYDWNDKYTDNIAYGSMQVHRTSPAQVLFAFNRWTQGYAKYEFGIGNLAHTSLGSMDWTMAAANLGGSLRMTAGAYEVAKIEIWTAEPGDDDIVSAEWSGAAGDGDVSNPNNWNGYTASGEKKEGVLPTRLMNVMVSGDNLNIQVPVGTTLDCASFVLSNATLGANCDLRGLGEVTVATNAVIDLHDYALFVQGLAGDGSIINTANGTYTTLDYISSGAGQYILTDYVPTCNDVVSTHVNFNNSASQSLWCSRQSNAAKMFTGITYGSKFRFDRNTKVGTATFDAATNVHYEIIANYGTGACKVNGTNVYTMATAPYEPEYSLSLFRLMNQADGNTLQFYETTDYKMYHFRICGADGAPKLDLVPAKNGNVAGLWDRVSGAFYSSASSDAFNAGAEKGRGEVVFYVPSGETATRSGVTIAAGVIVSKEGAGTLNEKALGFDKTKASSYDQREGAVNYACSSSLDYLDLGPTNYCISGGTFTPSRGSLHIGRDRTGRFVQNGGTVNMGGSRDILVGIRAIGEYDMTGGVATNIPNFHLGHGTNAVGTLKVSGGKIAKTDFFIGANGTGHGEVSQSGGDVNAGTLYLPYVATATGTYNLSSGMLTIQNANVGNNGSGSVVQSGGTCTINGFPWIGALAGGEGLYDMSGGTLSASGYALSVGRYGTGTLNVSGSAVVTASHGVRVGFSNGSAGSGTGTLVVTNGGTIVTTSIYGGGTTPEQAKVLFDGATIRATAAGDILKDLHDVTIGPGGLTITNNATVSALSITNTTLKVTPGSTPVITMTGTNTLDFCDVAVEISSATRGKFTLAEAIGAGTFSDRLPTVPKGYRAYLSEDSKTIEIKCKEFVIYLR